MKILTHLIVGVVFIIFMVAIGTQRVMTQDPVKVDPKYVKVLLENDRVRVLEFLLKPGEKEAVHSHPSCVVYFLSSFKTRFIYPAGDTTLVDRKAGEVFWREPVTHAGENVGTTDAHGLVIEVKEPKKASKK